MVLTTPVILDGVEQVQGGVFHEILPLAEGDEVLVVDFYELMSHAVVFPGAGGGEHEELHVLQIAGGGYGALAVRAPAPGHPQDICQRLVVNRAGGIIIAGALALGNSFHERHAPGHYRRGQFFYFPGTPRGQQRPGQYTEFNYIFQHAPHCISCFCVCKEKRSFHIRNSTLRSHKRVACKLKGRTEVLRSAC